MEIANQNGSFSLEMLDLGAGDLPMMDEPHHAGQGKYQNEHTKQWSAKIDRVDAIGQRLVR